MRLLLMRRALVALLALGVASASPVPLVPPLLVVDSVSAQETPPTPAVAPELPTLPPLGKIVAEDAMAEAGAFRPYFCPTGRNRGQVSPDGYRLTVTGRCIGELTSAGVRVPGTGVTIGDGDVEFEVREPVLSVTDATFDTGRIGLGLARRGDPDDAEVSVTWRSLRLTALADGDSARAPTYRRPATATPPARRARPGASAPDAPPGSP